MTRSQIRFNHRVAKKLKMTCMEAGMSRSDAAKLSLSCLPVPKVSGTTRRNPGRMDGVQWKSDSFLCPERVDGFESFYGDSGAISLLDIARPAKSKGDYLQLSSVREYGQMLKIIHCCILGIAKEYEVVKGVRQVIFLDDEEVCLKEQWEEWEEIHEPSDTEKPTYADVLKNK
ncbi:hypothetical protein C8R41DRAFT_847802 [Lentinula lateritia]|uniref:Uncharacterized protein n=1 Tax=Lentinula lateritia TaxID=40482 RepID=A0ABQ8V560_9AGAR|nr:hypothetical protein C8R41DRAFT_847802 [Lentinula lateritia]